ncbi:MAG TPA: hypothetical protein VF552_10060 [Allosphingosinicella sp.]|jgi:hypothetical protein
MLTGFLAFAILVIRLFPETPFARALQLFLVEAPLAFAKRIERQHLILLVLLLCMGQTLALLGSAELALAYAVDMSLYADAVIMTTFAAYAARFKAAWRHVRAATLRLVTRIARPRRRDVRTKAAARRPAPPSNDDEPAPALIAA